MLPGKISSDRMTYPSVPLPVMGIFPRLDACEFSECDVCALLRESALTQQIYRNRQLCFLDA
jgi:hypothetical protein